MSLTPIEYPASTFTHAQSKDLARMLLAYEATPGRPGEVKGPAGFRVCKKLGGSLVPAMGVVGFRSLLARALTLAGAEVPGLSALPVKLDGSLSNEAERRMKLCLQTVNNAEVIFVAEVLGLLVTFIGLALTRQLLLEIWPKMSQRIYDGNLPAGKPPRKSRLATQAKTSQVPPANRATQAVPA